MQAREGEFHLGFSPDHSSEAIAVGTLGGIVQEGSLSSSSRAAQHEDRAIAQLSSGQQPVKRFTLGGSTEKHGLAIETRRGDVWHHYATKRG
jgi:hypothetical protein